MLKAYDFVDAERGAAFKQPGKTGIKIMLECDVLVSFGTGT